MLKKWLNILLLIGFIVCLFLPIVEFESWFRHAEVSKDSTIEHSAIVRMLVSEWKGESDKHLFYGWNFVYPFIALIVLSQSIAVSALFKKKDALGRFCTDWKLYLLIGIGYCASIFFFFLGYPDHYVRTYLYIGSYVFVILLLSAAFSNILVDQLYERNTAP